jgi:hypothetical protein
MVNYAIVFMATYKNQLDIDFISNFKKENYDIYVICDKELITYKNDNIIFLSIDENVCIDTNYTHSNFLIEKVPSSWDKVLYYFCLQNKNYDFVWFVEYDVFIPRTNIFNEIDDKYKESDLLTHFNIIYNEGEENTNKNTRWVGIYDLYQKPWCHSMVCVCRLSRKLLDFINNFVNKKNRLIFIENMFNTFAYQNNMIIDHPEQLKGIVFRNTWLPSRMNNNTLYHPMKILEKQTKLRKILNNKL